jgi:DNA-binding MarR family transcriptional regulator
MDNSNDIYLAHQVIGNLFAVTNKIQAFGDKQLIDLTKRQMDIIGALHHLPEDAASVNNIARFIGTTKQSVKQVVDILVKKKYLSTSSSAHDRRAVNVSLTALGKQVALVCSERNDVFIAKVFQEFTNNDLETLLELLSKLYRFDGVEQQKFEDKLKQFGSAI